DALRDRSRREGAAGAGRADRDDVEAVLPNVEPECESGERAFLRRDARQGSDLFRRLETELRRIDGLVALLRLELSGRHSFSGRGVCLFSPTSTPYPERAAITTAHALGVWRSTLQDENRATRALEHTTEHGAVMIAELAVPDEDGEI